MFVRAPSQPVILMGGQGSKCCSKVCVLWVAGLTVPWKPPRGCFCPSHKPCVTLRVRAGRPREVTSPHAPLPRSSWAASPQDSGAAAGATVMLSEPPFPHSE